MRRLVLVLALVLAAGACGNPAERSPSATSEEKVTGIDFTAATVGGGEIDTADYAGEPLALWFWSPW